MFGQGADRREAKNSLILITDGISNVQAGRTLPEARNAKMSDNIRVFTVGITEYINTAELEEISSEPSQYHSFQSADFQNLPVIEDALLTRLCENSPPPPIRKSCNDF